MRRIGVIVAMVVFSIGLAGCGSSSTDQPTTDSSTSSPFDTGDSPTEEPTPDFPATNDLAGTFTTTGNGTQISTTWHVGEVVTGTPDGDIPDGIPSEAVSACNGDSTEGIAISAYVPLTLDIAYQQGSIATQVGFVREAVHDNASSFNGTVIAYDVDGEWECDNPQTILHPGATKTVHAVAIAQILGNQHPTFTDEDRDHMTTAGALYSSAVGQQATETVSGPGAICDPSIDPSQVLFLFRRGAANVDCSALTE